MARSAFRQLVNPKSIAALEAELKDDKARFAELFNEYGQVRDRLNSLRDDIERQEMVLEAVRSALPSDGKLTKDGFGSRPGNGMTKREIATEILKESLRPLFPREVRDMAVARGWIPDTHAASNQLSVAMAKAARGQIFIRDEDGRYSLPERGG